MRGFLCEFSRVSLTFGGLIVLLFSESYRLLGPCFIGVFWVLDNSGAGIRKI